MVFNIPYTTISNIRNNMHFIPHFLGPFLIQKKMIKEEIEKKNMPYCKQNPA